MKRSKFSERQIIEAIKGQEKGRDVKEICRELGISGPTFYTWRQKYGGMEVSQVKKYKELEQEHSRLKKMYAELSLLHHAFKDAVEKKL
ncbi:MAG: transposase [Flavobacteriales bacterium]|nr:transposase [Flavobacteriales bacterium]